MDEGLWDRSAILETLQFLTRKIDRATQKEVLVKIGSLRGTIHVFSLYKLEHGVVGGSEVLVTG